jgi:hypothetical protein
MDEVQNETSVAKMTQVEQCTEARADARMVKPDDAKTIAGVHKESVVVKVTPEAEQCDKAHADVRTKIAEHIKMLDEAKNESIVQLAKVTPKVERCTKACSATGRICNISYEGFENPPERQRSPQIDSAGIDLTMLSQLPASIQSEARIAVSLRKNILIAKGAQKLAKRAGLQHWFRASQTHVPEKIIPLSFLWRQRNGKLHVSRPAR